MYIPGSGLESTKIDSQSEDVGSKIQANQVFLYL